MKFKRILSLGVVLGAVLSVGMITSAMAAVELKEYPLNNTVTELTESVTDDGTGAYGGEYGGMTFAKLDSINDTDIKLNSTDTKPSSISFQVPKDCYLTVMIVAGSEGTLKITSDDEGFTETTLTASANTPVLLSKDKSTDGTDDTYTLSLNKDKKTLQISELEFTDATLGEPIRVISSLANGSGTNGSDPIAICRDKDNHYYAVAVLTDEHASSWNEIGIQNTGVADSKKTSKQVYKKINIAGIDYDASEFVKTADTKGNYLFAVKLNDTGSNGLSDDKGEQIKSSVEFTKN